MDCDEMRLLLSASADGELDAAHDAQLQRHVEGCARCQAERQRLDELRAAVRGQAPYHRAPEALRVAILGQVRAGAAARAGPGRDPAAGKPAAVPAAGRRSRPRWSSGWRSARASAGGCSDRGTRTDRAWRSSPPTSGRSSPLTPSTSSRPTAIR
ncbi:MAG: zf-HC2 domain-containing protein [Rhodospirillaceae bacterium]|nr:zf-HC2 domain-containing protein [Rhodospirillaceae bacterium]